MKALIFDNVLKFTTNYPKPEPQSSWAIVKIEKAGICNTDLEIIKGYMGFKGIPGHEFIGTVVECEDKNWIGKRVAAEINFSCNECEMCKNNLGRHCPTRTTMGIFKADGCFAEYCKMPIHCLIKIPDRLSNEKAVFIEPLSAACEIIEQLEGKVSGKEKVVILGDGKLGILCSWVLSTAFEDVTLIGHHKDKLELAKWNGLKITKDASKLDKADIVVEATGSVSGFESSIELCKPRGILILKSTIASEKPLNLSKIVVDEITIIGSRCGQFKDGLRILQEYPDIPLERLITATYTLEESISAFQKAGQKGILKILLDC